MNKSTFKENFFFSFDEVNSRRALWLPFWCTLKNKFFVYEPRTGKPKGHELTLSSFKLRSMSHLNLSKFRSTSCTFVSETFRYLYKIEILQVWKYDCWLQLKPEVWKYFCMKVSFWEMKIWHIILQLISAVFWHTSKSYESTILIVVSLIALIPRKFFWKKEVM